MNGNALQVSKVCFHCGAENGSHPWPPQRQNLKPKVLNSYYTEMIDGLVESIYQYEEKWMRLQRDAPLKCLAPRAEFGKDMLWEAFGISNVVWKSLISWWFLNLLKSISVALLWWLLLLCAYFCVFLLSFHTMAILSLLLPSVISIVNSDTAEFHLLAGTPEWWFLTCFPGQCCI